MRRTQKIVSKRASGDGIMGSVLLVGLTIVLLIALLGLVSTPALAKGHGRHHWQPEACSETASAAFFACYHEKKDDYWIAKGNCYNSDKKVKKCLNEAEDAYEEAKAECQDQLEARKDLCEELGEAPYDPKIIPAHFVDPEDIGGDVDPNPYFPLVPGHMWTYKTREDGEVTETNTVEVLAADKSVTIEGVDCVVVHDIVYEGNTTDPDSMIENTYDYYAQALDGTVWYFGEFSLAKQECDEETGELCQGLWGDEGSWQAGFEGGKPGIIMFAHPSMVEYETVYRQEFALGDAEDVAEVINFNEESVTVPYSSFPADSQLLQTRDFSPLEPGVGDYKYYAPGVGVILEKAYEDDEFTGEENQLESFTP